jgi:signal transduction histidine kinase
VNVRHFSLFQRRTGQDVRAWPALALLLLVILFASGCVLWFMREAMHNERMAVREILTEEYRSDLTLVQASVTQEWNLVVGQLDSTEPAAARFAQCAGAGLADSIICLDEQGNAIYPQLPSTDAAPGRDGVANKDLYALESSTNRTDEQFQQITGRLRDRVNDYTGYVMPSAQRRFIMHELQRLDPGMKFPTLAAEELAARYLEAVSFVDVGEPILHRTPARDVWLVSSPDRHAVALFTTEGLRTRLQAQRPALYTTGGRNCSVLAPGEDATSDVLATVPIGPVMPGWRLVLSLSNPVFDTTADVGVLRYLVIGSCVIAAMLVLATFIASGFGRQVRLARLKNDLVATVSHELKTPLTAMRAIVDTLLEAKEFDEKKTREYLELLGTENARLSRLIENFLTFSRLERDKYAFEFTQVRTRQIVDEAVAAMGERIHAAGCTLELQVPDDLPSIHGDSDALVTALLNLLDNAWKYSGDTKHIALRVEARGGRVSFAVQDNGIGLSAGESQRIFQRFYQADQRLTRTAGGCGLGLSIVQSIVAAHHGTVGVTSEPGHGSTFTIEIPVS